MLKIGSLEGAYLYALKLEYKLKRRSQGNFRGKEKLNLKVLVTSLVKWDIHLLSVYRRMVIGELLW